MTRSRLLIVAGTLLAASVLLGWSVAVLTGEAGNVVDQGWHDAIVAIRQPWMLATSYALNVIGGGWVATLLVPGMLLAALLIARRWWGAVYAAAALLVSVGVVQLTKKLFGRDRPEDMLVHSDYGSFPSGHTANAATLAVIVWMLFPRRWVAVLGVLWTTAMAFSRTLLSVHWLTDTLGGMMLGAGAALLVAGVLRRWASLGWQQLATDPEEAPVASIRPYRPSDRAALYSVCLETAFVRSEGEGDPHLLGDIFAVPYAERHPDLCWVVEAADHRTIGYIVGTDNTEAFETWFRDEWWPAAGARYSRSNAAEPSRQDQLISMAQRRGPGMEPHVEQYPAHLHINLLPETQGQGLGRQLIGKLFGELQRRGVRGLHLGMNPGNLAAGAFYERMGMHRLEAGPETTMYGVRWD